MRCSSFLQPVTTLGQNVSYLKLTKPKRSGFMVSALVHVILALHLPAAKLGEVRIPRITWNRSMSLVVTG